MRKYGKYCALAFFVAMLGILFTVQTSLAKETSVKPDQRKLELYVGEKRTLSFQGKKALKLKKQYQWDSQNKKVASISRDGVIWAKKPGRTKIAVSARKDNTKKTFIAVTVKKRPAGSEKTCDLAGVKKIGKSPMAESCVVLRSGDDVSAFLRGMKGKRYSKKMFRANFKKEALLVVTILRGIDEESSIESVKLLKNENGRLKGQIQVGLTALREVVREAACYENLVLRLPKADVAAAESFEVVYVHKPMKK